VVVDGRVEGPIQGGDVILKSQDHVIGDIHHQSLSIESGAFFDGRSVHARARSGGRADRQEDGSANLPEGERPGGNGREPRSSAAKACEP
jgi:cytoskeletal protein CcmA (bactofilin family)